MGRSLTLRMVAPALAALGVLGSLTPVQALVPAARSSPAEAEASPPTIQPEQTVGDDGRIAERIRGIFAELPRLAEIEVGVSEGVVTLSGGVSDSADRERAAAIASRVAGVATVENEIVRDTSVSGATAGVREVTEEFAGFAAMLPLLGAALLVWLAIGALGYLIAGIGGIWRRLAPNSFLAELIASAIRFVFVIGGLVVALNMLGAGALMGAVLGGAGLVGIALGFAMRDTIENYVASLMLSLRQPFRANDHVVIDTHEGRVIRLTSRATILMTLEGNHLRIPNGMVFRAVILNYTRNPQRRFDFVLGIDAEDDPLAAQKLGRETLASLPFVLTEPPPSVVIEQVGDSNIVLRFLGWVDQREADWPRARSNAIAAVKTALEQGGFALPEPIYRLRFDPRDQPQPLPAEGEASGPRDGARTKPARPSPATEDQDIVPHDEIGEMVAREREAEVDQDQDLLDSRRPVE
jgi:small conductance mechanosensitive channel